jgi:O-methyltransferase involved in polyketide biosynthesis
VVSGEWGDAVFPPPPVISAPRGNDVDIHQPHPARIYDYWLGGKDNFAADREVAEKVAQIAPWVISGARGNRGFLTRAVRYLARAGIRQFVDVGSGLPSMGNVHEIAQAVDPACRVLYVDNDPIVLVHARALLAGDERTVAVAGDARDPVGLLADPTVREHLDWSRPVAVLFVAVLHFLDGDEPARILTQVRERLVPGSYLVVSHVADLPDDNTGPARAAATRAAVNLYEDLAAPFVLRTPEQVASLFAGFDLVEPGLVPVHRWRPERGRPGPPVPVLAAVGCLADPGAAVDSRPGPGSAPRRGPGGTALTVPGATGHDVNGHDVNGHDVNGHGTAGQGAAADGAGGGS